MTSTDQGFSKNGQNGSTTGAISGAESISAKRWLVPPE